MGKYDIKEIATWRSLKGFNVWEDFIVLYILI